MSGQVAFILGTSLLCIPRLAEFLFALCTGNPWFYAAVGAAIAINLTYCAWRGERWAYYLLFGLSLISLLTSGFLLLAAPSLMVILLLLLPPSLVLAGLLLLALHPGVREFLDNQILKFERFDD